MPKYKENDRVRVKGYIKFDSGFIETDTEGTVATAPKPYAKTLDVYLDKSPVTEIIDGACFTVPANICCKIKKRP